MLVVDDIQSNVTVLSIMLKTIGMKIFAALSGEAAVKIAIEKRPDIIILDVNMPSMSGFEVCEILTANARTADIPIIFLTAASDQDSLIKGFSSGGYDYVKKPFHKDELIARINTQLALSQTNKRLARANQQLEENINSASEFQLSLLPHGFSNIENFKFFSSIKPSKRLSGDTLNYFRIGDKILFYIADVTGSGIQAALMSVALSRQLSAERLAYGSAFNSINIESSMPLPSEFLKALNLYYSSDSNEKEYFTILLGLIDLSSGEIVVSSAGQPCPFIIGTNEVRSIEISGIPIGMFDWAEYDDVTIVLKKDEVMLAYSDGLSDAMEKVSSSVADVLNELENRNFENLCDYLHRLHLNDVILEDDISLLLFCED